MASYRRISLRPLTPEQAVAAFLAVKPAERPKARQKAARARGKAKKGRAKKED